MIFVIEKNKIMLNFAVLYKIIPYWGGRHLSPNRGIYEGVCGWLLLVVLLHAGEVDGGVGVAEVDAVEHFVGWLLVLGW